MNINKRNYYTQEDTQFLIDNYLKLSTSELSEILQRSPANILKKGSKLNLRKNNKLINHNYFDNWSADMAYILGITMADGCIPTKGHQISYSASSKDKELLKYISLEIMNKDYTEERLQKNNKNPGVFLPVTKLRISSQKIRDILKNYHIVPRKTGKEKLCEVPDEFKSSYLLGLFDGDGCVSFSYNRNKTIRYTNMQIVSANQRFLVDVKDKLGFGLGRISKTSDNIFAWHIKVQKDVRFLADFMYSGNNKFCLQRKKERFNEIRNK